MCLKSVLLSRFYSKNTSLITESNQSGGIGLFPAYKFVSFDVVARNPLRSLSHLLHIFTHILSLNLKCNLGSILLFVSMVSHLSFRDFAVAGYLGVIKVRSCTLNPVLLRSPGLKGAFLGNPPFTFYTHSLDKESRAV